MWFRSATGHATISGETIRVPADKQSAPDVEKRGNCTEGCRLTSHAELAALVAAVAERRDRDAFAQLFDISLRASSPISTPGHRSHAGRGVDAGGDGNFVAQGRAVRRNALLRANMALSYRPQPADRWLRRDRVDFFDPLDNAHDVGEDPETDRILDLNQREERLRHAMESLPPEQLSSRAPGLL